MTKLERDEMNKLSKQILGSSSRWYTILTKGELVYDENKKCKVRQYKTLEEIKTKLIEKSLLPTTQEIAELISGVVKK